MSIKQAKSVVPIKKPTCTKYLLFLTIQLAEEAVTLRLFILIKINMNTEIWCLLAEPLMEQLKS